MEAFVSAEAGKLALLEDGGGLVLLFADDPARRDRATEDALAYLFRGCTDARAIAVADEPEAFSLLESVWKHDRALRMSLLLLDPEEDIELRSEAADCLEELLHNQQTRVLLENEFSSRPFPSAVVNIREVRELVKRCERVLDFVSRIEGHQDRIWTVRKAWDELSIDLFGAAENKLAFEQQAIERGVFRRLALADGANERNLSILFAYENLRSLPNARAIVTAWTHDLAASRAPKTEDALEKLSKDRYEDDDEARDLSAGDVLNDLIQEALPELKKRRARQAARPDQLDRVQREIDWIDQRLRKGDIIRAEQDLIRLIKRQLEVSSLADLVKTLTNVANRAAAADRKEFAQRCFEAAASLPVHDVAVSSSQAWLLHLEGKSQQALALFDQIIQNFRIDGYVYNGRAETLRAMGLLDAALAQYDQAIERFPTDVVGYTGRAETLRAMGRLDEALTQYDQAIERFPTNAFGYTGRAETLRARGRLDEALTQYDEAIGHFPADVVGYTGRAETLRAMGRLDAALTQYDQTIERFPPNTFGYNGRAETLRAMGRLDEALTQYDEAIGHFPTDAVGYAGRAETLRAMGRLDAALTQYDQTIDRFPANAFGYTGRAETLRAMGRLDAALTQYDQAIERFPTNAFGYTGRAETLRAMGRLDAALTQYDQAIGRFPIDSVGYNGRAETLRAMGRLDAALTQYDQAIERFPTDSVCYAGRAETLRAMGRLDAALTQYDQAVSLFPWDRFSTNGRAFILVLKGDSDAARRQLTVPDIPVTLADWIAKSILATADLKEGKVEAAIAQLQEAIRDCPFPAQKKVFASALTVARLRLSRQDEREIERAAEQIELLKPSMITPQERGVVLLLSAHIAGARKDRPTARRLVQEAQNVISIQDFAKRRLGTGLVQRYQLFDQAAAPLTRAQQEILDNEVFEAEILAVAA